MRKVISFMATTLDGYTEGPNGEFDWPNVDDQFNDFSVSQLNSIDTLLFGRNTYEGMASYWPTEDGVRDDPTIAALMNGIDKVVFSASLERADWEHTTHVKGDALAAVKELKQGEGKHLALFGSGRLTTSLLEAGLVDEVRVMLMPVLLGAGKSLFTGLDERVGLRLLTTLTFANGNVLLTYQPSNLV
jgi:dihydrofolate reductase